MNNTEIFRKRRQELFNKIDGGVAIIPAQPDIYRNNDTEFPHRQDSNFFYLTGFDEPESIAVLKNVDGKKEYILFVRPKDLAKEIWTGFRCGVDAAVSTLGADRAYSIADFDKQFLDLLNGCEKVFYSLSRSKLRNGIEYLDQKIIRLMDEHRTNLGRTGRGLPGFFDSHEVLGELRLYKSPEEIEEMRKAASLSAKAHSEVMKRCRPGLYEYQLEALFQYFCKNQGSKRDAYNPIVAGGKNATVLHYNENSMRLREGDLLLIDAGCEWNNYASDITRTFPINGKFSAPQLRVYEAVLNVQKQCVAMAKPGVSMSEIHQFAVKGLTQVMVDLKLLTGNVEKLIETAAYKRYYPHGTGHYLGLDVHDVGLYSNREEPRKLEPGMVFTIEPGLYILHDDTDAPQEYRGIGIRIEDDVVITKNGHEILTTEAPKEAQEMSAIIGSKSWLEP